MRLGVNLVHEDAGDLAAVAEQLGYAVAFAPEGYRSEAAAVLGHVAARTSRITLCGGVMQIPARTPGLAALAVATVDALSGGRAAVGLGVSNPDVSDGWYGARFDRPLARTREYVEILRMAFSGAPVRYQGEHYRLPLAGTGDAPLHLMTRPLRPDIPIHLAAVGPRALQLAGEIGDGWIGAFVSPRGVRRALDELSVGRRRGGRAPSTGDPLDGFAVMPCVATAFADDPEEAALVLRPHFVQMMGMGGPEQNVYSTLARNLGFGDGVDRLHERLAAGDRAGAAAAVPLEFIDELAMIGSVDRVAERMRRYAEAGATILGIMVSAASVDTPRRLRLLADAAEALRRSDSQDRDVAQIAQ